MSDHTINGPRTETQLALIIDDHPLFCDALSIVLKMVAGVKRVETAETLAEALEMLQDGVQPDIILLDLYLPDVNGLDGVMRMKARAPRIPVLIVSSMSDNRMIRATIRAGASGFVPKHSHRDVFRDAFRCIEAGETFLPEGYVEPSEPLSEEADSRAAAGRLSSLTKQQSAILGLICDGKLNKQIAHDLSIAETTVKAHVTAIMRKLGVHSRTQAVLIAQQVKYANRLPGD